MGHARRADNHLALPLVALLPADAAPQRAREYLVALLLARVDVRGDKPTGRERVLEPQQIATRVSDGFEERHSFPGQGVLYDVSSTSDALPPHPQRVSLSLYPDLWPLNAPTHTRNPTCVLLAGTAWRAVPAMLW